MSVKTLFWRLVPHKCVFGRARDRRQDENLPPGSAPFTTRVKDCSMCATTKPVRARGRKGVA